MKTLLTIGMEANKIHLGGDQETINNKELCFRILTNAAVAILNAPVKTIVLAPAEALKVLPGNGE